MATSVGEESQGESLSLRSSSDDIARFEIQELLPVGMTLVVLGIGLAFGLQVLGELKSDTCTADGGFTVGDRCQVDATNASQGYVESNPVWIAQDDTVEGVAKMPAKLPLVVSIVVAAVVIGILVRYMFVRFAR